MNIEEKLAVLNYKTDPTYPHITVNPSICETCPDHFCTFACPARCYTLIDGKLNFKYEDCVECGTCFVACSHGSVKWTNPKGGQGIKYKLG
ncbi:MAG: 4Fe-4S dicluster domain-containing protein [Candidatus Thermoplasmatota archaeon]|nr:4Fe-4S dicluster domain-containing protein [Candidatus Thermoplasmatota archaeon]